jgi:hypothetical protein
VISKAKEIPDPNTMGKVNGWSGMMGSNPNMHSDATIEKWMGNGILMQVVNLFHLA